MNEILAFFRELFLLKQEDKKIVGLTGLNRPKKTVPAKTVKKQEKELNLSDLMRRHKPQKLQSTIRPAGNADYIPRTKI